MKTKIFTRFVAVIVTLLCSITVNAATLATGTHGDLIWIMSTDGELVITGNGEMNYIDYWYPWYEYQNQIQSVVIGDGVTSIGDYAFTFCGNLTSVNISKSVTSIGNHAFNACVSLLSITIPEGVTSIGERPFNECFNLNYITVDNNNEAYDSREDCNAIIKTAENELIVGSSKTIIPNSVTRIGDYAFCQRENLTSITIPEGVTSIGDFAFFDCPLATVNIPASVTSIGDAAFESIGWSKQQPDGVIYLDGWVIDYKGEMPENTSIVINEGTKGIVGSTFAGCTNLISITIPESVTSIGKFTFNNCSSLTSINIPESVTSIGEGAFSYCSSLTSITIPESVISIGEWAFGHCGSLTTITIPEGVTSIGENAFDSCEKIERVTINCSHVGNWFQYNESIKEVILGEGVTSIGESAFSGCSSLTDITISESVTSIEKYAFWNCNSLISITIPESVTSIGESAFGYCSNLTYINCLVANPLELDSDPFQGYESVDKSLCILGVPEGSIDAYRGAGYWNEFSNIVAARQITYVLDGEAIATHWVPEGANVVLLNQEKEGHTFSGWGLESQPIEIQNRIEDMTNPQDEVLYTNAHCTNTQWGDQFISWDVLFDGDANTFFHSEYSKMESLDGLDHYLRVDVGEDKSLSEFVFTYTVRGEIPNRANYSPKKMVVEGSNTADGPYTVIAQLTALPSAAGAVYQSGPLSSDYRYIRYRVTETFENQKVQNHPYFFMAEFGMSECEKAENFVMPTNDVVLYGHYSVNNYRVNFKHGDGIISSEEFVYGSTVTVPEIFDREHYRFVEWGEYPVIMPAHDVEVMAKYALEFDESEVRDFYHMSDEECISVTYTRFFDDTEWQALYVPFEIPVDEYLLADFEIADLNDIRQYDYDNDGVKDETVVEAFKVTSGVLEANYPYLIRAKEIGAKVIALDEATTVYATEENDYDCSSLHEKYTFTGNYGSIGSGWPVDEGYYTLVSGEWQLVNENTALGAFRFYLKVDSRKGGNNATFARSIRLRIVGENGEDDDATDVTPSTLNAQCSAIYDLMGRRVEKAEKGVYIVNGKKMVIK